MDWLFELGADYGAVLGVVAVVALVVAAFFGVSATLARRSASRARTELALVRRRYAAVLASTSDGVLLHSASGQVIDINAAAREMLGLDGQDYTGVLVNDLPVVRVNA